LLHKFDKTDVLIKHMYYCILLESKTVYNNIKRIGMAFAEINLDHIQNIQAGRFLRESIIVDKICDEPFCQAKIYKAKKKIRTTS